MGDLSQEEGCWIILGQRKEQAGSGVGTWLSTGSWARHHVSKFQLGRFSPLLPSELSTGSASQPPGL